MGVQRWRCAHVRFPPAKTALHRIFRSPATGSLLEDCTGLDRHSFCLFRLDRQGPGQEPGGFGGVESVGITSSYSPDSSHILIGEAEQRRTWTGGRRIYPPSRPSGHKTRWDFEASLLPFYQESDPATDRHVESAPGHTYISSQPAVRVTYVPRGPLGYVMAEWNHLPGLRPLRTQDHRRRGAVPAGRPGNLVPAVAHPAQLLARPWFVVAARDIPVDNADQIQLPVLVRPRRSGLRHPAFLGTAGVHLSPRLQRQPGRRQPRSRPGHLPPHPQPPPLSGLLRLTCNWQPATGNCYP